MSEISEQALRKAFDEVDRNGDGSLSLEELNVVLVRSGWKLSDKDFAAALEDLDADENGRVSFAEFAAWVRAMKI